MRANFAITDFTVQWVWVGIIVGLAVLYAVISMKRRFDRAKKSSNPTCAGCILSEHCESKDKVDGCDRREPSSKECI